MTTEESDQVQAVAAPGQPIVFRHATVVTMDPQQGVLADTDVLVRGDRIEAVGRRLEVPADASVIDAEGGLLTPGFIDTHRHTWQSSLRGVGADWTLSTYFQWMVSSWGSLLRPEDIYAATYLGMVEAVNDGVTTVMDWAHGMTTPEHADAAVDALFDVPGRARFGYGNAYAAPDWVLGGDVDRLQAERFTSRDQRVSLQLALDVLTPSDEARAGLRFAQDRGLPVSSHAGVFGVMNDDQITFLSEEGFLSPAYTLVHGGALSEESYRRIADSGAQLSISAESELNAGQGYPPVLDARAHGINVSLSVDTVLWWSGDMFSMMRATLNAARGMENLQSHQKGEMLAASSIRAHDVLDYATMGGARALGLDQEIGSVVAGKKADLVLVGAGSPAMTPISNPIGHLVFQAGRGDVDTVMVDGRALKHRGQLVGVDLDRARRQAADSLAYLRSRIPAEDWERALNP